VTAFVWWLIGFASAYIASALFLVALIAWTTWTSRHSTTTARKSLLERAAEARDDNLAHLPDWAAWETQFEQRTEQ
jgi:hypothetical protein